MKPNTSILFLGVALAMVPPSYGLTLIQKSESFDTATSAAADGWWELGSRNGNATTAPWYGWTNTGVAGAAAGAAGGLVWAKSIPPNAYGDVFTTMGVMSMTNTLTASGSVYIPGTVVINNQDFRFGFFQYDVASAAILNGNLNVLGFYFQEPKAASHGGLRMGITGPGNTFGPLAFGIYTNTLYNWTVTYSPPPAGTNAQGSITLTVLGTAFNVASNADFSSNVFVYSFINDVRTNTYNAFGMADPNDSAKSSDRTQYFFDDLSYTTVSNNPAFLPSVAVPGILNVYLAVTNQAFATIAIPPQLNASNDYTVTLTSANPSICTPVGSGGTTNIVFPATTNTQTTKATIALAIGSAGITTLSWSGTGATFAPSATTTVLVSQNANVPSAPVVWLPLTNSFADLGYSSVSHNFGAVGAPSFVADAPASTWAGTQSMSLDGASYVLAGNASDLNVNDLADGGYGYTMCAWIKTTTMGVISAKSPVSPGPYSNGAYSTTPAFMVQNNGALGEDNWQVDAVSESTLVNDGAWHHVAVTFDGAYHTLYLDGVRKSTMQYANAGAGNEGANLAVGEVVPWRFTVGATANPTFPRNPGVNSLFSGEINDFMYWNQALTDVQLNTVYQNGPYPVTVGFTQQPANQTRLVGQTATFTVAATPVGTAGPLRYQWTTNGINVLNATNASYVTAALGLANGGVTYQCAVANSTNTVLSQAALLTVVTCVPMTMSPAAVTTYQAATNQTLTVSFPAELNDGNPVSVDLVSTAPAVAVAAGATGDTLTLVFLANTPSTQTVPISTVGTGTALFYLTNVSSVGCATTTNNATTLVTAGCLPLTVVNGCIGFREPGTANQPSAVVSLPLSAPLGIGSPITVNLVSDNPSVATPVGAVDGVLALTFNPGGTNAQAVPIQCLAVGTAHLVASSPGGTGCLTVTTNSSFVTVALPGASSSKYEPFDTLDSTTTDGWTGFGNQTAFENYGWVNSGNAASTPGEAGGIFERTTNRSYFADVTIGLLTLNDYISATGTVMIVTPPTNNLNVYVAYFNTSDAVTNVSNNFMGVQFYEAANGGPNGRFATVLGYADNTFQNGSPTPGAIANAFGTPVSWDFEYDPTGGPTGNGQVVCNYSSQFGSASMTNNVSAAKRAIGATFNAFGLATRAISEEEFTGEYYLDNVSYTVGGPVRILKTEVLPGNQVRLTFQSGGATNQVLQTSSLAPAAWTTASGVTYGGPTNLLWTATFAAPAGPAAFFRVVANPSP